MSGYMLHVTCQVTCYMLHVRLHVTCYMLHVRLHVTCYMLHVTCQVTCQVNKPFVFQIKPPKKASRIIKYAEPTQFGSKKSMRQNQRRPYQTRLIFDPIILN